MKSRSSTSSRSISNSADSALSTSTSRAEPSRESWRQSSEPIEPPAPVTSTVLSLTYDATSRRSTSTCSRPSTSSTCTGRIWAPRLRSPAISSCRPGSVFTTTCSARHVSTIFRRTSPRRRRHRDQHLVGLVVAQQLREVVGGAEHLHAVDAVTALAAGRRRRSRSACSASCRLRCSSRTISWPASPAPTISTSLPWATSPAGGRSISVRASSRVPATKASSSRKSSAAIDARQPRGVHGRERVEHEVGEQRRDRDAARGAPHVARRDVAPPAVVEAEDDERRQLDRDDDRDRPASRASAGRRRASPGRSAGRTSAARRRRSGPHRTQAARRGVD